MHREDQHRQVRIPRPDVLQQVQAVGPVERNIDDHDVGLSGFDAPQRRGRFFGDAADRQIGLPVDQQGQTLAHDRMIVDHEDRAPCETFDRACLADIWVLRSAVSDREQATDYRSAAPDDCTSSDPPIMLAR